MTYTAPDVHLLRMAPLVLTALAGIVTLVYSAFVDERRRDDLPNLALFGLAAAAVSMLLRSLSIRGWACGHMLNVDGAGMWLWLVFLAATAGTIVLADEYFRDHGEVFGLLLLACCGMMLMAAGGNLVVIFIGLETMSVALYVMAAMGAPSDRGSKEAALKYLLLGAFATGFLVYGMAYVYGGTASLDLGAIAKVLTDGGGYLGIAQLGFALLLVGLGFKVALVPFHMWAPDVYEGAPTVVTAFMAVGPKVAGFAAMLRILVGAAGALHAQWAPVVAVLAVATMLVGNLGAIPQTNIKRLLAYSSIAHAGYLMLGILAGSAAGAKGLLYYSASYAGLSLAAFAVVLVVNGASNDDLGLDGYRGLYQRCPLAAASLAVSMLGMAGMPPTSGFFGKLMLFRAAVQGGWVWVAVLGVLCSFISVYYYIFRLLWPVFMAEPAEDAGRLELPERARQVLLVTLVANIVLIPLFLLVPGVS